MAEERLRESNGRNPSLVAVPQLREQVLTAALAANAFLSLLSVFWMAWNRSPNLYYYLGGFAILLGIIFYRRPGYTVRAAVLLGLVYLFGVTEYWKDGFTSSGNISFMAMIILSGLFFGLRTGLATLLLSVASICVIGWRTVSDPAHLRPEIRAVGQRVDGWMDNGLDMVIIGLPILIVFVFLIRRLTELIEQLQDDMAEREQMNSALAESEQQYRLLAENVKDVVYLLNMNLDFEYCSPSVEDLMGYTPAEIQAMPVSSLFTPSSFQKILTLLAEELQIEADGRVMKPEQRLVEYEVVCKDGSTKWLETGVVFVRDEAGTPVKILGVNRDISERKRAEAERAALQTQMLDMQKLESLGHLAGGIAHDFNNLLMSIMGNIDLALERSGGDVELRGCLEEVIASSQRASDLCGQLLAYSGRGKFLVQPVNVAELIEEMSGFLKLSVSKGTVLQYTLPPELPAVEVDIARLRQAIMNPVLNSSEAIGSKGGTIHLTAESRAFAESDRAGLIGGEYLCGGRYVCITVQDDGCGMSEEIRSRMFDPFYSTKEMGHGLGLAALLGFVRSHSGALHVKTAAGAGTTMTIWLPASEKTAQCVARSPSDGAPYSGSGLIMMVDDEESILRVGRRALERRGFEVITAPDGEEAVALFRTERARVRAVILDMTMPRMNGIETFHALRELEPGLRVVLSSGYSKTSAADELGIAGFLQKPYRVDDLVDMVRRVIESPDDAVRGEPV